MTFTYSNVCSRREEKGGGRGTEEKTMSGHGHLLPLVQSPQGWADGSWQLLLMEAAGAKALERRNDRISCTSCLPALASTKSSTRVWTCDWYWKRNGGEQDRLEAL